jgi:hypothetical protein
LGACGTKEQSNHESERSDVADESPVEMEGLRDHGLGEHGKYPSGGQGGDSGKKYVARTHKCNRSNDGCGGGRTYDNCPDA